MAVRWAYVKKRKVLPEPYGPWGGADLRFLRPSARHQILHYETMDTWPVYRAVCLFTSQQWSRYQIILLGDRGTCVWTTCLRSLPRQCPGAESNLRLWVNSGLQVRHVTVRLPSRMCRWAYVFFVSSRSFFPFLPSLPMPLSFLFSSSPSLPSLRSRIPKIQLGGMGAPSGV